jgi:phosphoribosylamine--glycine ligase
MAQSILVIGGGGREHALCWKLAQSPEVSTIYCAPGNGGTAHEIKTQNVAIPVSDLAQLIAFAQSHAVALTVVGPDNPLADGIVDAFIAAGLPIFGPNQAAAQLESSKAFAKQFMASNQLPTARFEVFDAHADALAFCQANNWARVIKVDGLALGKGVYVCDSVADCEAALAEIFTQQRFGDSGRRVVVESRLVGPEVSILALCDGKTLVPLLPSRDFKRRFDNNQGPNTGGMGAYAPVSEFWPYPKAIEQQILKPLEKALQQAPFRFKGLLYIGLMLNADEGNKPYILEFNARFGDPETQCLMPLLQTDLLPLLQATIDGNLATQPLTWHPHHSVCISVCADTYPTTGSQGQAIKMGDLPMNTQVFHAGTAINQDEALVTNGGRVLNIVGLGKTATDAYQMAYQAVSAIDFDGMAYRHDIGAASVFVTHPEAESEAALCR